MRKKQPPKQDTLLRKPQVLQRTQIGSTNWEAGIKAHKYPAPIYLSPRVRVWRESDIDALIASFK